MRPWKPKPLSEEEQQEHRNLRNRKKRARRRLRSIGMPEGLETPAPQPWRKVIAAYRKVRDVLTKGYLEYLLQATGSDSRGFPTFTRNREIDPVPAVMQENGLMADASAMKCRLTDIGKLVVILHLQKAGT